MVLDSQNGLQFSQFDNGICGRKDGSKCVLEFGLVGADGINLIAFFFSSPLLLFHVLYKVSFHFFIFAIFESGDCASNDLNLPGSCFTWDLT